VENWWNDTDREKTGVLGEKSVPVPLCPHKSHVDWPQTKIRSPW